MGATYDPQDAVLIALDWGTTSLRAYLLAADGRLLDSREGADGILSASPYFEKVLKEYAGAWLDRNPALPVLMSGMVGSRQGWVEVPYVSTPAGFGELAAGLLVYRNSNGQTVSFVPGVQTPAESAFPDVMRGEETQIFGAIHGAKAAGTFVLPGTHSKWVQVADGRIQDFRTFMTGELFSVLRGHSILGRLMYDDVDDADAFERGVVASAGQVAGTSAGIMAMLFSVRTLGLFNQIGGPSLGSYLSGLLIGAEIREAKALGFLSQATVPTLIGNASLCHKYLRALALVGVHALVDDSLAAPRGLLAIAHQAGVCA